MPAERAEGQTYFLGRMIRSWADGAFQGEGWEEAWSPQVEGSAYSCRRTEISSRRFWGKPDPG